MRILVNLVKWDAYLLFRYAVLPVALAIGCAYYALVALLDLPVKLVEFIIFSDPTMMGFVFVGVMVLFEKQLHTNEGLGVTPLKAWQYLYSKSIALSIPVLGVSLAIGMASGYRVSIPLLIVNVMLSSTLFLLLGFVGAVRVKTFNQYILIIPLFLAPTCLPLLDFFGVLPSPFFWIIPTQSTLYLFDAAFGDQNPWLVSLAIALLVLFNAIAFRFASKAYIEKYRG